MYSFSISLNIYKMKKHLKFSIFILFFFINPTVFSQTRYQVSGKITDEKTNETLPGASIVVKGTNQAVTSDLNGNYSIDKIRNSQIELTISYVGYNEQTIQVDFQNSIKKEVNVKLTSSTTQLKQVEIKGSAEGQVKAMLSQKNAENIKNVVSYEQIEQFPDQNAAEVVQRIPGITLQRDQGEGRFVQLRGTPPELTNFNINGEQIPSPEGNVRYVGLDVIAADQIEQIEVTKVLTPDMDGDGIGGTVNIITKKAKDEKPEVKASISGGYGDLRQSTNQQYQFGVGQRIKQFGYNINGSYHLNNQGSDNLEFKYAKGPFWGDTGVSNYKIQYREMQLRHYQTTRTRIGLSANFDYHINNDNTIYLRGMFNDYSDDETRRRMVYSLEDALSETYYIYGGIERDIKARVKRQTINTLNAGGNFKFNEIVLDYESAFALAQEQEPNRIEANFDNFGQSIKMEIDRTDPTYPVVIYPDSSNAKYANTFEKYGFENLLLEKGIIKDRNYTTKFNIQIPYQIASNDGFIKFGGKYRQKNKSRDVNSEAYGSYRPTSLLYPDTAQTLTLPGVYDGFREDNLLNQGYVIEYIPSPTLMRNFYEFNRHMFVYDRTETKVRSFGVDYTAKEKVYSTYFMISQNIGNLLLITGLRYERTDIEYQGRKINLVKGRYKSLDTLSDKRKHEFILPQIQFKYSYSDNLNFRLAYTTSYSRPSFEDVLPYREQEDLDEVRFGNSNLKFPLSKNYDFLVEKYLPKGGVLSGGLFYKQIDHFVTYYKLFAHEGDPKDVGLVEITSAENGVNAYSTGAELVAQSKFYWWNGFFSNFGVYFNYTYTLSDATIYKRIPANYSDAVVLFDGEGIEIIRSSNDKEHINLPGQAQHTTNMSVFYDNSKLYLKLSANYHDDFLYRLGGDKDLDEYYAASWHWDLNAHYSITKNLKVFGDWVNISNAPLKYYLNTPDRIKKLEFYSWTCHFGLKLDF